MIWRESISNLERTMVRAQGRALVVLVLLMLLGASYSAVYRNLLRPLHARWAGDLGAGVASVTARSFEEGDAGPGAEGVGGRLADERSPNEGDRALEEGGAEGFGGGLAGSPPDRRGVDDASPSDGAEGFGGGLDPGGDGAEGFGGGLEPSAGGAEGFGGELGTSGGVQRREPIVSGRTQDVEEVRLGETRRSPPAWAGPVVGLIEALELRWIDVLLRHLVIVVGFLGALIATASEKHINIDALSRLLSPRAAVWVDRVISSASAGVCVVLAVAGARLVGIGRTHPQSLVPGMDAWVFQLAFPIGFGLMALHFVLRAALKEEAREP